MISALWRDNGYLPSPPQANELAPLRHPDKESIEKPVAAHFCQSDHSPGDLEVRGIEKIHDDNTQWRVERESFTLRTLAPEGMNLDDWERELEPMS